MSFVRIPTDHLRDIVPRVGQEFIRRQVSQRHTEKHRELIKESIAALGGDGNLALNLVGDWVSHPYVSRLRWAITAATGQNVAKELEKVQKRAYLNFLAQEKINALMPKSWIKAIPAKIWPRGLPFRYEQLENNFLAMNESARLGQTDLYIATVCAVAALTQYLTTASQTLYRGICCDHAQEIVRLHSKIKKPFLIGLDHATSFTESYEVANNFSLGLGVPYDLPKHQKRVILKIKVPLECMVASPKLFHRLLLEYEYVIATDGSIELAPSDVLVLS